MATRTISDAGGAWNSTATWVEGVVAGGADDVVSTATSGSLNITASAACRSIDLRLGTLTFTIGSSFTVGTSTLPADGYIVRFGPGTSLAGTGFTITNTVATQAMLDFGGKTLPGSMTFIGNVKLMSALTLPAGGGVPTVSHTNRTFNGNGQTITTGVLSSTGTTARTLLLNGCTVNARQGDRACVAFTGSNLTLDATGSVINVVTTGSVQITIPGVVLPDLNFNGVGCPGIAVNSVPFTCERLTRNSATVNDKLLLPSGLTINITDRVTLTGPSAGKRLWVAIGNPGISSTLPDGALVPCTFALAGTGTAVLANVDFMDVAFTGVSVPVGGAAVGDCGGNSGISFTAPRTLYWVGEAGTWSDPTHWSLTSGGATGAPSPLSHDSVVIDANSMTAGRSITIDTQMTCKNITSTTSFGASLNNGSQPACMFGDLVVSNGIANFNGGGPLTLMGRGNHVLDQQRDNNTNIARYIDIRALGTYTIVSSMRVNGSVALTSGTLAFGPNGRLHNDSTVAANIGSLSRTIDWGTSGQWTWTPSTAQDFSFGTAASKFTMLNADNGSLIVAVGASTNIRTNGNVMPPLTINSLTAFTLSLLDAYTTNRAITLNSGTLDTTGKAVTCSSLASTGSTTRALTLGASTVTINGSLNFAGTGLTVNPGTSTIVVQPTSQADVRTNGLTFNTMTLKPADNHGLTVRDGGTWSSLTVTGTAAGSGHVAINQDITVTGTLNATGTSGSTPVLVYGPAFGGRAAISAATTTLTNARFTNIITAGTGSWAGTSVALVDTNWSSAASMG